MTGAPEKPGKYWARSDCHYQWWNLIVHIGGTAPYLYVASIVDYSEGHMLVEPKEMRFSNIIFGPELEQPEDIKKP